LEREFELERKTKETQIKIKINIDGTGDSNINTSIPFFDHLLTQISVHGSFDLSIEAIGDLDIDIHHLVEDTGILLGKAFGNALGNKIGITRIGHCIFPMDETLVLVAVDLSSRAFYSQDIKWINPFLGSKEEFLIPVDLIEHFLYSFAINAQITLHIKLLNGNNNHHIAEGIFKALGKALDQASRYNFKRLNKIPSSKGEL
jgi:imidazoleglycerol-phosphate dehydratase